MAALLVFAVFLIGIAVSVPIGVSMIMGSAAPIFLMGKGGSAFYSGRRHHGKGRNL